jgi:hypothetical protein
MHNCQLLKHLNAYLRPCVWLPHGSCGFVCNMTDRLLKYMDMHMYMQVDQCLKEAQLLKTVWDMIAMVTTIFTEWRKTKWDEIDVERLQEENKKLAKVDQSCHVVSCVCVCVCVCW